MKFPVLATFVAALGAAACSSNTDAHDASGNPLYSLAFLEAPPAPRDDEFPAGDTEALQLEFAFERGDGGRSMSPRIVGFDGQSCSISIGEECDDGTAVRVTDGLRLEVCAKRVADGGVCVNYRIHLAKVGKDAGTIERADAEGARWVEPGVHALLARIPSPDGGGPMLVLTRVTIVRVEQPESWEPEKAESDLSRAMTGHTRHLRVSAVEVNREIPPGTVLDETAMPDVLKPAGGRLLSDLEAFTCIDSRVRLESTLQSRNLVRGLVVRGRDDGRLDISWTTSGPPRTATIRPNEGRRFVALAALEGGMTAGVIVSVDAD